MPSMALGQKFLYVYLETWPRRVLKAFRKWTLSVYFSYFILTFTVFSFGMI
jgi:hypothetical protein